MEEIQIDTILGKLSDKRKIFHSEGDFQFSLGCEIQSLPNMKVVVERPMKVNKKETEHIDMLVYDKITKIGIELKFMKGKFAGEVDGDEYHWPGNEADDLKCYGITKDIQRLEHYVQNKSIDIGYSIVLTNDPILWKESDGNSNDDEFRVAEGRILHGTMAWKPETGANTKVNHENPISLIGKYPVHWQKYSKINIQTESNNIFKYLVFKVDKSKMQQ